jgi:hypothetical protein
MVYIPQISTKQTITSHLKKVNSNGHQFHKYQQKNNHLSHKESLNSDGHQFHQYQQNKQSPLILAVPRIYMRVSASSLWYKMCT